jgi:ELWxxDGT repeat protein
MHRSVQLAFARAISRGLPGDDVPRRLPVAFFCALFFWLCWLALTPPLQAQVEDQVPYLVKDITPGTDPSLQTAARQFVVLENRVVFANTSQVWATDGTAAGTVQLAELPCDDCNGVSFVAILGAQAFFTQEQNESALWRTDGTRAGTVRLASLPDFPLQSSFAVLGGKLFFSGCASGGCGLMRSDGTVAGTALISATGASTIAVSGAKLYYFAAGGLWVSDGTAAGTHLAASIGDLVILMDVTPVANGVVFIAQQGGLEVQLWTSNGTPAGTLPLTRFTPPMPFPQLVLKAASGGQAYFVADDGAHGAQLWRTNGTAAGTVPMTNLAAPVALAVTEPTQIEEVAGRLIFFASISNGDVGGNTSDFSFLPWVAGDTPGTEHPLCSTACAASYPEALVKAGGRAYFVSLTGLFDGPATLWATDGTTAGTRPVAGACADGCNVYSPLGLAPVGNTVYFDVTPSVDATPQLWATDGTAGGTRLISPRAPDLGSIFSQLSNRSPVLASPLAARGAQLFFGAADDAGAQQVWLSTGTPGSEVQLTDFIMPRSASPSAFVAAGSRVFFVASGGANDVLWQSDGTATGTSPVPGALPFGVDTPASTSMLAAGGMLFYLQGTSQSVQLWRTDGTAGGTLQLTHFAVATQISSLAASPEGRLFFSVQATAATPTQPAAIWESDGTVQGTVKAFDSAGSPNGLTFLGPSLYFTAIDSQGANGVWKSDGTAAANVLLTSFAPQSFPNRGYVPGFTAVGSRVFFSGLPPQQTLMVTDGTPAGTAPVVAPPAGPTAPFSLTAGATRLYMLDQHNQLWRSDGTAGGTEQVSTDCCLTRLATLGDEVFFLAYGNSNFILFRSDGTEAGTVPVVDPAAVSIFDQPLVVAGGRVFFSADDGEHGRELWQTDGTTQGTRMVADLAPGPAGSAPGGMTQAGNLLFFAANDGLSGDQLWALPLTGGPACQPSDAWLCLLGGRFRVESAWRDGQGNSGAGHAVSLTVDTGWFWFFGPENIEVMLKVLDGRALDDHFWVFYGALSDVSYTLTVTDTLTGVTRRYENPPGQLASVADTFAFGPMGATSVPGLPNLPSSQTAAPARRSAAPTPIATAAAAAPAAAAREVPTHRDEAEGCQTDAAHLCIQQGRFTVAVTWQDFSGRQGLGTTVPLTSDTGAFWFFDPANIELVVKVLDGRAVNGKLWVFYGALSDVGYTLTVTDTATGAVKIYQNAPGQLASVADTSAF